MCYPRSKRYRVRNKQSGQAIVLILLLTLVGVVGAVSLVSTGLLTSEKMQLQYAADASAYSVSVIEARDLNYTAYMNRAMVANEVAIGQMVSMMSWANMSRSTPEFIDDYAFKLDLIIAIATLGTASGSASSAVKPVTQPLRTATTVVYKVVEAFTKPVTIALSTLNRMYNLSQQGVHLLSFIFSASTLFDIKDKNIDGADFSEFGAVALARHFTSYYGDLLSQRLYGFVDSYSPGADTKNQKGMHRLAQVINDSRDGFTKNRKCDVQLGGKSLPRLNLGILKITFTTPGVNCRPNAVNSTNGGWDATLFGVKVEIDVFLLIADFSIRAGIGRQGGTDLREGSDGNYTWSGTDTSDPRVRLNGGFKLCLGIPLVGRVCTPRVGFDLDPPIPPFGVGAALAGNKPPSTSNISYSGADRDIQYGGASRNVLAWDFVLPPFLITPSTIKHIKSVKTQFTSKDRNIHKGYNLRGYLDTDEIPNISTTSESGDWISGMEAPYLLVALTKDDVVKNSQSSLGRFKFDPPKNGLLGSTVPMGVIAKSEVYYTRPSNLSYFKRSDGREEKPNGFNPYWQARLVDTSYIDRVAALAFQHGQAPLPAEAFAIISQAQALVNKLL